MTEARIQDKAVQNKADDPLAPRPIANRAAAKLVAIAALNQFRGGPLPRKPSSLPPLDAEGRRINALIEYYLVRLPRETR